MKFIKVSNIKINVDESVDKAFDKAIRKQESITKTLLNKK